MARWQGASIHALLLLTSILVTEAQQEEFFRQGMGTLGTHYNLRRGRPYIQCNKWSDKSPDDNGTTECVANTANQTFFGQKLACHGLYKIKDPWKYKGKNTAGLVLKPDAYEAHTGGCWTGSEMVHTQCSHDTRCIAFVKEKNRELYAFCCCKTHLCNTNVTVMFPIPNGTITFDDEEDGLLNATTDTISSMRRVEASSALPFWVFIWIGIFVVGMLAIFLCICRFTTAKHWLRLMKGDGKKPDEVPLVTIDNGWKRTNLKEGLTLNEMIAKGKANLVHKGTYKDPDTGKERAIVLKKISDQKSFLLEEAVYRVCANTHAQLAHFLGSNFAPGDLYVVLEYEENGCLEDYLKTNTFTPLESLTFLASLMDGLAFLHSPCSLSNGGYKAAIMHRDIKSRNVLVKADRTAAIVDFGLAMICEGNKPYGRHYQVGTHRYMSPELLISLANLNMDGLKMADVYAVSLIIWEMLNRTVIDEEDEVRPAELPYETELQEAMAADEPSFRAMNPKGDIRDKILYYLKNIVHRDNRRPVLRERLKENAITAELVKTTLDMWDFEVDGRISAACAHARLSLLRKDAIAGTIPRFS